MLASPVIICVRIICQLSFFPTHIQYFIYILVNSELSGINKWRIATVNTQAGSKLVEDLAHKKEYIGSIAADNAQEINKEGLLQIKQTHKNNDV